MVVIEALLIGVVSQVMGILIGLILAMVLIYVINVQSFAWTIQFHLPVVFLLQMDDSHIDHNGSLRTLSGQYSACCRRSK